MSFGKPAFPSYKTSCGIGWFRLFSANMVKLYQTICTSITLLKTTFSQAPMVIVPFHNFSIRIKNKNNGYAIA